MAKETNEPEKIIVSKKHIARQEKEQKQRKWLLTGIITLVVVIVFLVVYGALDSTVLQPGKAFSHCLSPLLFQDSLS